MWAWCRDIPLGRGGWSLLLLVLASHDIAVGLGETVNRGLEKISPGLRRFFEMARVLVIVPLQQ